jgi:RNAse (barnase) inhibitor barstar
MTSYLGPVTSGDLAPGRYRLAAAVPVRHLRDELVAAGWTMRIVDGGAMTDRASLFGEFAVACDFPEWFGGNWDAFADCLGDLSWLAPGPVAILWQRSGVFEAVDPTVWRDAGRVIDAAITARVAADLSPLYVIYPAAGIHRAAGGVSAGGGPMLQPVH